MKQVLVFAAFAILALSCGGGSETSSSLSGPSAVPSSPPTGTAPVLLSVQPDSTWSGQYLLNYSPSSYGTYGTNNVTYVPQMKDMNGNWALPSTVNVGVYDRTKQLPLNLDVFPEALDVSVRVQMAVGGSLQPSFISNPLTFTTLPFPPTFYGGYDSALGRVRGLLTNQSHIPHTFLFEVSPLDSNGDPTGWVPMASCRIAQNPSSTRLDDLVVDLDFPPVLETSPVKLRATTLAGSLSSIPSPTYATTLGLAIPTGLQAAADPSGIHLSWINHSTAAASVDVFRLPGRPDNLAGLDLPLVSLPPDTTSYTDIPPVEGSYRYFLRVVSGNQMGNTPEVQVATAGALTPISAQFPTPGFNPLLRMPDGHMITWDNSTVWESDNSGAIISSNPLPAMSMMGSPRSCAVDSAGRPHLLYQGSDINGYHYHHLWRDAEGWHDETLPSTSGIWSASTSYDFPSLLLGTLDQLWVVAVNVLSNSPMELTALRQDGASWSTVNVTSPSGTVPDLYSTDQCLAMAGDGTLSCTFSSGGHRHLLQRRPDGTAAQLEVPYLADPDYPQNSLPVSGLAAGTDGRLHIIRSKGGNDCYYQTFDGSVFSTTESVPLPPALTGTSFDSASPLRLSVSADRLAWVIRSGQFYFVALRDPAGWHFSGLDLSWSAFLLGFDNEALWCLHFESDPLTKAPIAILETQP